VAAKQFAAKVEERTKGQVKIAIYPANQLGSAPGTGGAGEARLHRHEPSHPGALDKYVKAFSVVMLPRVRWLRPCPPDIGRTVHELAGAAGGKGRIRRALQLGMGVPQPHQQQAAILKPEDVKV